LLTTTLREPLRNDTIQTSTVIQFHTVTAQELWPVTLLSRCNTTSDVSMKIISTSSRQRGMRMSAV